MNHLIGQKISITSRKPQTTQHKINGVLTEDNYQFIFVDTPGFQKRYMNKLNNALNQSVINSLKEVDIVLFLVEAGIFNDGDMEVLKLLPSHRNVILVISKQDKLKEKNMLQSFANEVKSKFDFKALAYVSAKHNMGLQSVINEIKPFLPKGDFLYPNDQLTDKSSKFLVSEIVREKLFRHLGEELPYSLAVQVEEYDISETLVRISITIIVDKENQKGIVIGKSGLKLKTISSEAREDIQRLLGVQVYLQAWVKVKSGFADEAKFLQQFE